MPVVDVTEAILTKVLAILKERDLEYTTENVANIIQEIKEKNGR